MLALLIRVFWVGRSSSETRTITYTPWIAVDSFTLGILPLQLIMAFIMGLGRQWEDAHVLERHGHYLHSVSPVRDSVL